MSSCGFYLWSHRSSYFHLGTQRFGPGDGEWLVESPDVHGLSSAKLANASALHERRLARRDCFLVVKDGVIVHEAYHNGGDADTLHYVESAGSVAAALLAGAAARHGLLDLDTPLHELGITAPPVPVPRASDPATAARERRHPELRWGSRWREVTTRHLLSQTTGWGRAPPGTTFDLDPTGDILAMVSKVLWATTGRPPAEWAREHLTGPLGAPDFFNRGGVGGDAPRGDVSVAGGQMATCRDAARFGQLIVNRGRWLAKDGSVRVLVEPEFIAEMTRPAFPRANPQYGFLAWVHPGKDAAGNPRAGTTETTTTRARTHARNTETTSASATSPSTARGAWDDFAAILGDDAATRRCGDDVEGASPATRALLGADGPDFPVAVAMGRLGKFILSAPEAGLVVVSMGNTWGSSAECPSGLRELIDAETRIRRRAAGRGPARLGLAPRASVGYDDVVVVRALWSAVGDAVTPNPRAATRRGSLFGGTVKAQSAAAANANAVAPNAAAVDAHGAGSAFGSGGDDAPEGELGTWFGEEDGADGADGASGTDADGASGTDTDGASGTVSVTASDITVSVTGVDYDDSDRPFARSGAPSSVSAASRQKAMDDARAAQAAMLARATGSGDAAAANDPSEGYTGSCRCSCPPANGVGQCVNMRGVPEARCDSAQILDAARGFCPALGVVGECPAEHSSERTSREGSKREDERGGERERSHARRVLADDGADDHAEDGADDGASVKISAARFSAASSRGLTVPPESPAFACSSSSGCEPSLGGASVESFLCQPLRFHTCSWHDELCDGREPSHATRRAVRDRTPGAAAGALAMTEPSAASYLGLRAATENGDVATRKTIHQTRGVVAAITAAAVVALAAATRLARSGDDGGSAIGVGANGVGANDVVAADVESALVGKGTGRGVGAPSYGAAGRAERVAIERVAIEREAVERVAIEREAVERVAIAPTITAGDGTKDEGSRRTPGSAADDVAAEETPTMVEDVEAKTVTVTVAEEATGDETPALTVAEEATGDETSALDASGADSGEDAVAAEGA